MTTIGKTLSKWRSDIDSLDAELIIAHALGRSREFVLTHAEYEINKDECAKMDSLFQRRADREPIAHILGHKEFFGLDFEVTKDTLIPRPETELLVEEILKLEESKIKDQESNEKKTLIMDVGTGSGNIAISLAKHLPNYGSSVSEKLIGIDLSPQALAIASSNAKRHGVDQAIVFIESDLLENVPSSFLDRPIDSIVIAANLPYLSHDIYMSSMIDVKKFEPRSALVSDENGLRHYRRLLEQLRSVANEKPSVRMNIFFEISPEQKSAAETLVRDFFPDAVVETITDLTGRWRLVIINHTNKKTYAFECSSRRDRGTE